VTKNVNLEPANEGNSVTGKDTDVRVQGGRAETSDIHLTVDSPDGVATRGKKRGKRKTVTQKGTVPKRNPTAG